MIIETNFNKKWKGVFGHLSIYFFSILLSSCFKEVPYPFDAEEREVVLTGFNTNVNPFKIQLNYSAKVLETAQNPINNANVYLYKNEQIIDTLQFVTEIIDDESVSYYKSTYYPNFENEYSIKAITNDGKIVETQDYITNEPIVSNVQILENQFTIVEEGGYEVKYSKLNFTLTDIIPTQNLYEIKVSKFYIDDDVKINCYIDEQYISDIDILNDEKVFYTNGIIFSDKFFNQNSKNFEFYFSISENWSPYVNHTYLYVVKFNNISENYYRYIRDVNNYNIDNEHYNIYNNIVGGTGIFALCATKQVEIIP